MDTLLNPSVLVTSTILRKRKRSLVLHLSGGETHSESELTSTTDYVQPETSSEDELPIAGPSKLKSTVTFINGRAVSSSIKKRYECTFEGCTNKYSKPSRLEEHERTHRGEKLFRCTQCDKSYFRETHLQAHTRTHLPASERPFVCSEESCQKRFWTSQHLRVHAHVHRGERTFTCQEEGCDEAFMKNYQLRTHIAEVHRPAGTKPFLCTHEGCPKSFTTNQKLRAHSKVHSEDRYTCVHADCLSTTQSPLFFTTWSSLQTHMKSAHPPACPYPSCHGRIFASQKGLRGHLKVHEDREIEDQLRAEADDERETKKRRRGGDVGRDWHCTENDCTKAFKSSKALKTHVNIAHLGRRDFICPEPGCNMTFGYKHLLQRHTASYHTAPTTIEEPELEPPTARFDIDAITGKSYLDRPCTIHCPWPSVFGDNTVAPLCKFSFTRAYDLRRHLKAVHDIECSKEVVDRWVKSISS